MVTKITTQVTKNVKPVSSTKPEAAKSTDEKKAKHAGFKVVEGTKFEVAVPEGFSFAVNKPLKKSNFSSDALFFEHKAHEMSFKKDAFLKLAAEAKAIGSRADRAKIKRIKKMQEKMAELTKQLSLQGIDVESLLNVVK